MLYSMNYLSSLSFVCADEVCGDCEDLYFEDESWRLRYLVAKSGGIVFSKRCLLPPESVNRIEMESCNKGIPLNIGKVQFESAPSLEQAKLISRKIEAETLEHFRLPAYWLPGSPVEMTAVGDQIGTSKSVDSRIEKMESANCLRSFAEVKGYDVRIENSIVGVLHDLVLDVSNFTISHLAIDTKPARKGGLRLLQTDESGIDIKFNYRSGELSTNCSIYHLLESPSADLSDGRLSLGDQQKIRLSSF